MPKFLNKFNSTQILGLFALLGILFLVIKLSWAIPVFTPDNQPIGYVAQDEVTNTNLTGGGETLFRAEYKTDSWGGNLFAYSVTANGAVQTTGGDRWTNGAKDRVDAQALANTRLIATMSDAATAGVGIGVPFQFASLSATQKASLAATINTTAYTGTQIVDFLRGGNTNEGANAMRDRSTVLGDIIHSRPYYVADTNNPTVFVGSNDGMLHAINAKFSDVTNTGKERWAYVPSMLISKLKKLAYSPNDATNPFVHNYFVDGQINVATLSTGKRVLVGGLGAGGKGLYALDITSTAGLTATTEAEVASKVLWEITPTKVNFATPSPSTSYANLGYTYGTPTITKINNGGAALDVVIIGNGYNDAATGESYLYVINATTGALVKAIQAGTAGTANANGLSSPVAVDTDNDGYSDRVYAGDLNGTMWKFDLSSPTVALWSASALLVTSPTQSITTTPGVALHPNGGYMVTFGTGRVLSGTYGTYNQITSTWTTASTGDLVDSSVHYVYGVWDGAPVGNTALLTQTLSERIFNYAGNITRVRRVTANAACWTSTTVPSCATVTPLHKGWKVALPAGERVLGEGSFIENGRFYFSSYNPTVVPHLVPGTSTNIFGENWLMELNFLTGGSSAIPFLDMDNNLLLNDSDRIKYISTDTSIPTTCNLSDPIIANSSACSIISPSQNGIPVGKWLSYGVQSQPILVTLQTLNTTLFNQNPDVIFPPDTTDVRGVAGGHFDVDIYYGATNQCSNLNGDNGTKATGGRVDFSYSGNKTISNFSITINGTEILSANNPGSQSRSGLENWVASHINSAAAANYTFTVNSNRINIDAINAGTSFNATTTQIVVSATGLIAADYSKTAITGGVDPIAISTKSSTSCTRTQHIHEYDDLYDKTGIDMLNASDNNYNLSNAIPTTATNFKVLLMNQYLSPAVSLHIGNNTYSPASATGYVLAKNYQTSANLNTATNWAAVPSYNRSNVGSLVLNMPVDAFTVKDWWGNGDLRVGLHPDSPQCVYDDSGVGADMYNPTTPPANGVNGPATLGTTDGARHNGALTVQIIKNTTPSSSIEENVPGRPEYGYRVKHADFFKYVLVEYNIYWHHPRRICYDDSTHNWYNGTTGGNGQASAASGAWNPNAALMVGTGWTKNPPEDTSALTALQTPDVGSTDPKLGSLGSTGTLVSSVTTVAGMVTTRVDTYIDGMVITTTRTANDDGTVTIVKSTVAPDGTTTTTTETIANASGNVKTGGDEKGLQARTGRISWHELIRD
jgi:type IV pilus assembly protein PilY1